ncbi:SRPBCC family protein [Aquihabitans daechungensis]|uniref:SRPBCC family protein n=1 Tax=Aquihabitans daechungensis TaxID=1052257 RepID=UPI003BA23190
MTHRTLSSPSPVSSEAVTGTVGATSTSVDRAKTIEVYAGTAAEPAAVWQLLTAARTWTTGADFDGATDQASGLASPLSTGAVRAFRAGPVTSRETVLALEPHRHLAYDYVGSLPYRWYRGEITLMARPAGTQIRWRAAFQPRRRFLGPVLRIFMTVVVRRTVHRLAAAAAAVPSAPSA